MLKFLFFSIGKKYAMALSSFLLMIFLLQHFLINVTSVFSPEIFNELSHFMGSNILIQFLLQPILIFGVIFHFFMGFILEFKNWSARKIKYVKNRHSESSTWMSRNMIYSGIVILAFMILHFVDFWFPEIYHKYIVKLPEDLNRYHEELTQKFKNLGRTIIYVGSFIFLSLHLLHGFKSAFRSLGADSHFVKKIKLFSKIYAIGIPLGFIMIALFHHFNQ